jgi:NAD(P)H dehydrogenase (quinone)
MEITLIIAYCQLADSRCSTTKSINARTFAAILGRPVRAEEVPRETWGALFRSQGAKDPVPRIQMLDGFNQGWIAFEGDENGKGGVRKGEVERETVLRGLAQATTAATGVQ